MFYDPCFIPVMLQLYNTLTRRKDPLRPIHAGEVRIYSCGPTVYWFAHIGNMRAYLFADTLQRFFKLRGFKVTWVMNITDVGHLTSDADDGEDKMIVAMKREGKTAWDIASVYTEAFFGDLKRLNIESANQYPRATAHIQEQIEMIQQIEKNGFTYKTTDGIYFDTSKLADYGRLSGQKAEDKKAGARVDMGEKKHSTDFALWKFSSPSTFHFPPSSSSTKRDMEWPSPWGIGFPGWHIECSAMSKKYLGIPFDVHTGGIDHIAVHHENELAQTEGAEGKLEANIWMHNEFITIDGGKMSKSLGNIYTIQDLIDRGYDPLAFRYLCLGAHYRSKLNFTFEALDAAQNALKRLRAFVRSAGKPGTIEPGYERAFDAALDDDINTPQALGVAWQMQEDSDLPPADRLATWLHFDRVFGLRLADEIGKKDEIPAAVQRLLDARAAARAAKDWKKSDVMRDEILKQGFLVEDGAKGQMVRAA